MPTTISAADAVSVLDLVGSSYLRGVGTQAAGYGVGTPGGGFGSGAPLATLKTTLAGMAGTYLEPVAALVGPVLALANGLDGRSILAEQLRPVFAALQAHVASSGNAAITSLDTFLTYYNVGGGGTWQALQSDLLHELFRQWLGNVNGLSPWNHYFEVLQGATYANAIASGAVTGPGAVTTTPGYTIDDSLYAGGFPWLKIVGLVGSGLVTVTGKAFDPLTKATVDSVKWTVNLGVGAANAALAPGGAPAAPANSLILAATHLDVAAGITGGTIYVEARRPAGRSLLPQ